MLVNIKQKKKEKERLLNKLWGDNYFDPKTKKWKSKPEDDEGNEVFE